LRKGSREDWIKGRREWRKKRGKKGKEGGGTEVRKDSRKGNMEEWGKEKKGILGEKESGARWKEEE
jgi:hypothetical protein